MTAKRKYNKRAHVTLSPELQKELQDYADKMETQQTHIIRAALIEYFERHASPVSN